MKDLQMGKIKNLYLDLEENVQSPSHYTQGTIECIEAIKAALTQEEFRGFCKGNAIKYIWRERYKGGIESLLKAIWYLQEYELENASNSI